VIPPVELPPLAPGTVLPADIRAAGKGAQQEYRTALAFERVLLSQLTKAMQATVGGDDDESGGSVATKTYRDMLPDKMADALVASGGTGLAHDLVRALRTDTP
jgi:Rod binding domain-containing protein